MTYLYIIIGIWTVLALSWTTACLSSDATSGKPSRLERLVRAAEDVGAAYRKSQDAG